MYTKTLVNGLLRGVLAAALLGCTATCLNVYAGNVSSSGENAVRADSGETQLRKISGTVVEADPKGQLLCL